MTGWQVVQTVCMRNGWSDREVKRAILALIDYGDIDASLISALDIENGIGAREGAHWLALSGSLSDVRMSFVHDKNRGQAFDTPLLLGGIIAVVVLANVAASGYRTGHELGNLAGILYAIADDLADQDVQELMRYAAAAPIDRK